MEFKEGAYRTTLVPLPSALVVRFVLAEIEFAQGAITGVVDNPTLKVGGQEVRLSDLRSIQLGGNPSVVLRTNKTISGSISGLTNLTIRVGQIKTTVDCSKASKLTLQPYIGSPVDYVIVASRDGKEVTRLGGTFQVDHNSGLP
jgi:hypothetical protein